MKHRFFSSIALPYVFLYLLLILSAIGFDYLLHLFKLSGLGRSLGYVGTITLILSFIYSLRKYRIIEQGSPKKLLQLHEYLAWAGSLMLLVHAGIHYNAHLPWIAIFLLLIIVASGFIGKNLLKKANESLASNRIQLINEGLDEKEIDKKLFFDSVTVKIMKQWRTVHMPIALLFGILSILHIITIFMFKK